MFKSGAERITMVMLNNNVIEENEFNVYSYGIELLIAFVVNIIAVSIVGIFFGKLIQTFVFLLTYCPLRQYAGGYHAGNYTKCTLTFTTLFIATILIINNIDIQTSHLLISGLLIVSFLGISYLSPVESRNNPLTALERKHHKRVAIAISGVYMLLNILLINLNIIPDYIIFSAAGLILVYIMQILAILTGKRTN
ncbi:MAG: accessory gene regulator B family protein [Clostridioides sp.]|jgi:accessory gene regulator B|nr:accessory gene regulator B family protein [Clostridioides sp.]